jgi:hypothetical protein
LRTRLDAFLLDPYDLKYLTEKRLQFRFHRIAAVRIEDQRMSLVFATKIWDDGGSRWYCMKDQNLLLGRVIVTLFTKQYGVSG